MSTVGINPLDNTFRSGHIYLATPANVPRVGGQTGAGVVVESRHPAHQAGDRVFVGAMGWGLVTNGTWREYVAAPAAAISPIPANIDDDVAAAYLAGAGYLSGYLALTEFREVPARTDGACSRNRECRRDGNPSGCSPPRRIDDDLHRKYYAKGRAGACCRLRACHRPVQREHERRCPAH